MKPISPAMMAILGATLLSGCAAHKPAKPAARLVIPPNCIEELHALNPKAQCVDLGHDRGRCKDFEVVYHCVKVTK